MIESLGKDQTLFLTPTVTRLDATCATTFRSQAAALLPGHVQLVMLMHQVEFVDSTGLGTIVALLKLLPPGGGVRLVGAQERVVALLRLTRLDRVFRVFPTVEAALAA